MIGDGDNVVRAQEHPMPPSPSASLPASPHLSSVDDGSEPVPRRHAIVAWFSSDRGFGQLRTEAGDLVYVDQRDIP